MPTCARYCGAFTPRPATFTPLYSISPEVGVSSRFTHRSSVDLPEPDAPIMLITSPFSTEKSMSRSTSWLPKALERWFICNIVSAMSFLSSRGCASVVAQRLLVKFRAALVKGCAVVGVAVGPGSHDELIPACKLIASAAVQLLFNKPQ